MVFSDLLRLLVLQHEGEGNASDLKYLPAPDSQIKRIFATHWDDLVRCIIDPISKVDLTVENKRGSAEATLSNFNLMSLKFFGNVFYSDEGFDIMQDPKKSEQLVNYCLKSMTSFSPAVKNTALQVLTNAMVNCRVKEKNIKSIKACFSSINDMLRDKIKTPGQNSEEEFKKIL